MQGEAMPESKPFATSFVIRSLTISPGIKHLTPESLPLAAGAFLAWSVIVGCFWPAAAWAQAYRGGLLEAVMLTLTREPGIQSARSQVELQSGVEQGARAEFDTSIIAGAEWSRVHTPLSAAQRFAGIDRTDASNLSYSLGSATRLRSGVSVAPLVSVDRVHDNGSSFSAPASGNVALRFSVPLLKGSGVVVNTANERAARDNLQAAGYGYRHAIASGISRTVNAYWDLLAALRSQQLRIEAEQRSRMLRDDAQRLARGDEIPPSDVLQYEAQLARDRAQRIAAAQALETARAAFAVAVGLDAADSAMLADPAQDFPEWSASDAARLPPAPPTAMPPGRSDLLAQRSQLDAAQILQDAARRDNKSQLDLNFSIGYSGQTENRPPAASLEALGRQGAGVNVSIGINYVLPVQGNQQAGLLRQRAALADQARIEFEALQRRIVANIRSQHAALTSAALQLEQVRTQLRLQTQVFANERKKYALGQSTVFDVLSAEIQLNQDGQQENDARRQLAQALVNYRFETGTLLRAGDEVQMLSLEGLTTVPEAQ
jgi:outer membrane protein TolC